MTHGTQNFVCCCNVANYVTHTYFYWKRNWRHTPLFLLLLLEIWDLLLSELETQDLLQFNLLLLLLETHELLLLGIEDLLFGELET